MAYSRIKKMVLDGEVTPETVISEEMFSRHLGLGRTPVREAVKRLVYEGYFHQTPQGGVLVHKASLQECRELYDLRFALEEYVMSGVPLPLSGKASAQLEAMIEKQRSVVAMGDAGKYILHDIRFHTFLFELYGNNTFTDFYLELRNKFIAVGLVVFNEEYTIGTAWSEHCVMVDALKSGSNQDAVLAVRSHIMHAQQQLFSSGGIGIRPGHHAILASPGREGRIARTGGMQDGGNVWEPTRDAVPSGDSFRLDVPSE